MVQKLFEGHYDANQESEDIFQEKGLSNHKGDRKWSDKIDRIMGWTTQEKKDKSKLRRLIHAKYHTYIGDQKKKRGNLEGAEAEYKRAQEHREKAKELSFFS